MSIGNTDDANIEQWPSSIDNLINKFPSPTVIIPGHGTWGDKEIYTHTLNLLKK